MLLSYMAIEAWLWIQHGTHQRKSDTVCLKRYEMRLAVMGILSSGNLAGAVICRNPFQLNPPLWIAALSSGIGMMRMRCAAESELPIQLRNIEELAQEWEQLSTKSVHSEEYN